MRSTGKDNTLKNVFKDVWQFAKENPFTAAGSAFLGVIRVLLFAASIYSFVKGLGSL